MTFYRGKFWLTTAICGYAALFAGEARAGSHTWDVNELFSSADGTIQFIELSEVNGTNFETGVLGHTMFSNAKSFVLAGSPLAPPTGNKFFLIATQTFADLPGAPTPDAIIPLGVMPFFFAVGGDSVEYDPWDTMTFGAGLLPTDGVTSLNFDLTTGVNSPTNYAGQTGSIDLTGPAAGVPTTSEWGLVVMAILILSVGTVVMARRHAATV